MAGRVLECDLGNTRAKWRVVEGGAVTSRGSWQHGVENCELHNIKDLSRICVASVASDKVLREFLGNLKGLGVEPELASVQREIAGVSNAYGASYQQLGVDRWLAVVAAYHRVQGAALVLDAGSALTVDLIDGGGEHCGGYILPGERMMEESLLGGTGKVRFDRKTVSADMSFGRTTAQAVTSGVLAAQVGAVGVALQQVERQIASGFAILVTGGAGSRLMPYLPERAQLVPDLVLDGLKWVMPAG